MEGKTLEPVVAFRYTTVRESESRIWNEYAGLIASLIWPSNLRLGTFRIVAVRRVLASLTQDARVEIPRRHFLVWQDPILLHTL